MVRILFPPAVSQVRTRACVQETNLDARSLLIVPSRESVGHAPDYVSWSKCLVRAIDAAASADEATELSSP